MDGYGIPEYDDYFGLTEMEDEELVNFIYTMDEKNSSLAEIEGGVMKVLEKKDIDQVQMFYMHHIDLFIRYQYMFADKLKDPGFRVLNYMKWRNAYASLETYFNGLRMHYKLSTPVTPVKSIGSVISNKLLQVTGYKYTKGSIFAMVDPHDFARICHKLYVYYYFMSETRFFHYVSRNNSEMTGYASELTGLFNNFYRKMEFEVELFCLAGNTNGLVEVFTKMTTTLLNLGNIPLAKVCISLIERFKMCKEKKVQEFQRSLKEMKLYNKYKYFVTPDAILRAFIQSNETNDKARLFGIIYKKILDTKKQLIEMEEVKMQADGNDFIVYNYLQPSDPIKTQLYSGRGEIDCLKEKCRKSL